MKALKLALIAGVAAAAVAGFASAASAETTVAYNVGVANDYVFRGIDQTFGFSKGEVFGGVDVSSGPLYVGTWLSNTGPQGNEGGELDVYGGYKVPLGGTTLDLGVVSYNYSHGNIYTGSAVSNQFNNYEVKAALTVPVGAVTLGANVFYTPDYAGTGNSGTYYEVNGAYTFGNKATVSGAYGMQKWNPLATTIADSYQTWNVGVTYPITEKLSVDARYIGTDSDAKFLGGTDTAVGTLKLTF